MDVLRETFYQTLLEAAAIFSAEIDTPFDAALQKLTALMVERLGVPCAWVGWLPQGEEWVQVRAASGPAAAYTQGLRISVNPECPEGRGPAGHALRTGNIGILDDLSVPEFSAWRGRAQSFGLTGIAEVPFTGPNGARGILVLYQSARSRFPDNMPPLLQRLQQDLGYFLQRREAAQELHRLRQYQDAALAAQQELLVLEDPLEMLRRLTGIIVEKTDAIACHVVMPAEGTPDLHVVAASARDHAVQEALSRLRFPKVPPPDFATEDTVAARSFLEKGPTGPVSTDTPWLRTFLDKGPALRAIRALMGWPILLEGEDAPYAVLVVDVEDAGHFTDALQQLLLQLTNSFSVAVERKRQEESLRESEERWKFALEGSEAGVFDWDIANDTLTYSDQWKKILGWSLQELHQSSRKVFSSIHPEESHQIKKELLRCLRGELDFFSAEFRMHCKDGRWKWVLGRGKVVRRSADNRPLRLIGTITDISLRKAAEEEVRHMAFHDTLTGLPNRAALDVHLDKAMARAQRHKKMLAVCLLDLDDFKPVNDTHGHAAGDLLLRSLAARLQAFTRKSDFLARLGGDEFVLLVEDLGSETDIHMVLDNVQQAVGMPFVLSGQTTVEISASMGVCLYDPSQTGELIAGDILLRRADLALYQSKERGPGRDRIWRIYENASKVRPRVRDLLSAGRLRVFYQPVMDSRGRRIAGAEALARLEDTDGNILPPAEFLPQFTKQDLTSLWKDVLSRVLGDVKSLQQQGLTLGTVSVNMDPSSFCGECVDVLRAAFAHSDVPPSKITLEILESSDFLVPKPETLRVMQEIKALGVHLAMDDVGSAYSSLQRLWELPIDAIKLASNLVRTLPDSPQDLHFVLALRDLARGLGVRLIVEGVETAEILDAMMVLDVPLLQGHAIAAPMPLARLEEWLRHAPKWQDEHPNSPLGIYAYQMAQLDTLQTMIAYDPSLPEKLEMKDPRKCPVQRYLRRLGFGEGSEIDRLHQEYHHAFMDFGAMLASSSPMDEWQEIVRAHEALQQALVRAWKTVDGPQVRPFHLQVVKR